MYTHSTYYIIDVGIGKCMYDVHSTHYIIAAGKCTHVVLTILLMLVLVSELWCTLYLV